MRTLEKEKEANDDRGERPERGCGAKRRRCPPTANLFKQCCRRVMQSSAAGNFKQCCVVVSLRSQSDDVKQ